MSGCMCDLELLFISGRLLETEIPKEKRYLLKYFRTSVRRTFLKYYLVVRNTDRFTNHTGVPCDKASLWKMVKRFHYLEEQHARAKSNLDFELLAKIETGKFRSNNTS